MKMPLKAEIRVSESDAYEQTACGVLAGILRDAVRSRRRAAALLSGGSTPWQTYARLAQAPDLAGNDWADVSLFWADERFVPPDDVRSNYGMARKWMLGEKRLKATAVFPVDVSAANVRESAERYEETIAGYFGSKADGVPVFDLAILGMGRDGHMASLFPMQVFPDSKKGLAAGVDAPGGGSSRVTVTLKVLETASRIVFLAKGPDKAQAVLRALSGGEASEEFPVSLLLAKRPDTLWVLDKAAASAL
ncbi:MAG: 6-phosphogluconolactonase [Candidatus Omnitrophica bacterium]|nr:6-phosphogluconolactonase [Candidatus Omnitrophota bacterium]